MISGMRRVRYGEKGVRECLPASLGVLRDERERNRWNALNDVTNLISRWVILWCLRPEIAGAVPSVALCVRYSSAGVTFQDFRMLCFMAHVVFHHGELE